MADIEKRPYRQIARAAATQDLRQRIVFAFHDLMLARWIDEITLDEVAVAAGTTRQTVIRLFGGKNGVLESALAMIWAKAEPRVTQPRGVSTATAVGTLLDHYEAIGDVTIRLLAQEELHPVLRGPLNDGRAGHRQWVARVFGDVLVGLDATEQERRLIRFIAATDVYTWKLLRRDFGLDLPEVTILIGGLVDAIKGEGVT
jgi:AcrR family transcriptional regulator